MTFFGKIGVQGAGTMMNLVVMTAAFSSLNAGLYSTGRILRSMAMNGSAPKFTGRMSGRGVPYGGICLTASIGLLGVLLNGAINGRVGGAASVPPKTAAGSAAARPASRKAAAPAASVGHPK